MTPGHSVHHAKSFFDTDLRSAISGYALGQPVLTRFMLQNHCYYQVVLPLIDAYWGVAELMLSVSHTLPLKASDLSNSLHENLLRMHQVLMERLDAC